MRKQTASYFYIQQLQDSMMIRHDSCGRWRKTPRKLQLHDVNQQLGLTCAYQFFKILFDVFKQGLYLRSRSLKLLVRQPAGDSPGWRASPQAH